MNASSMSWVTNSTVLSSEDCSRTSSFCRSVRTIGSTAPNGSSIKDRKSTRLNSSHVSISYAVFCLKKKKLEEDERVEQIGAASARAVRALTSHRRGVVTPE